MRIKDITETVAGGFAGAIAPVGVGSKKRAKKVVKRAQRYEIVVMIYLLVHIIVSYDSIASSNSNTSRNTLQSISRNKGPRIQNQHYYII